MALPKIAPAEVHRGRSQSIVHSLSIAGCAEKRGVQRIAWGITRALHGAPLEPTEGRFYALSKVFVRYGNAAVPSFRVSEEERRKQRLPKYKPFLRGAHLSKCPSPLKF